MLYCWIVIILCNAHGLSNKEVEKERRLFVTDIYWNSIGVMRGRTRRENSLYSVSFRNVKKRVDEDLPRTNNAVEGFHSALRSSITCKHPNIQKLIAALKNEEELQQTKIIKVNRADASARKKIYKSIYLQLKTLVNTYDNSNKISFLDDIAKILTF